ncbi:uncharacterized protein [Nicotiana tomentosiformis]|uniref:uncharacterized protein n=1 Tax=Nicotiana tomentosiformis TaxID=4098 RepID=UPI00388C7EC7
MDDMSGIRKDNVAHAENVETSDGRSTLARNDLVLRLEQNILELQGELEQVRNLENLSLTLNVPDINQQNVQNPIPPQNTQNQHPQNPSAPHQYATPPQNPNPPPVPTPPQHHHHLTQYPQITTNHIPQNAPQPTPDPQNSTNDHHYTQIPRVHQSNPIYVKTLPHTSQQILYTPESAEKDLLIKNMAEELKKLTSRVQGVEGGKGIEGLNSEDLCIQPDVELPEGYKPPKFEMFDETGDPKVHLRTYYDKLVGVGKDKRIRMKLFMRSLTGDALSWYIGQNPKKWINWVSMASDFMDRFRFNLENAPDVFYIQNLKKKPTETFREYATRWRSEAAKVRPALEEEQMNKFFVRAQDPQYYERLMVIENHKFSDIIKLGEIIEEGIKSGMVANFEALQATNKALQSGGISKKKEVGTVMVAQGTKSPLTYQTPPPTNQPSPPRYQQPAIAYHTYNIQPAYYHSPPTRQNYQKPMPKFDYRSPRQYTPITEPIDQLYERLKAAGYVTPIPAVTMENSSQWVNPNKTCAYYSA